MVFDEEQGPVCDGCKMQIDPGTCQCGNEIGPRSVCDNHHPVPMGCACHLKRDFLTEDPSEATAK